MKSKRNRPLYVVITLFVVVLGLLSRRYGEYLPAWLSKYAGDTLWATMVYFLFAILFARKAGSRVAVYALAFSFLIEISQLYHAPWIDAIRATRLGGLVLGYGFLWSDLLCYSVGVILAFVLDKFLLSLQKMAHAR